MPPARRTRPNAPGDPLPALAIGPTRRRTQGPPGLRSLVVPEGAGPNALLLLSPFARSPVTERCGLYRCDVVTCSATKPVAGHVGAPRG